MAWFNEEIAGLLREYAELTQITGGDVFRARNYEKAARSVRGWADDIGQLDVTALRAIPGVGASIAAKIAEYRESGSIRALDELRAKIPPGVLELTRVPGLGPKRALQLNRDLGVQSVDDLAAAIKAGRLDGLSGVIIGALEEIYRNGKPDEVSLSALLSGHFASAPYPVVRNWPSGHGRRNRTLPLGTRVTVDTESRLVRFEEPGVA